MAYAFLNLGLNLRCSSTIRACISEERSNGATSKTYENVAPKKEVKTPLVDALKAVAEENVAGFYFPGHNRGRAAPTSVSSLIGARPFFYDLTGLPGLDSLFAPEGPVLEAQQEAAKLFGASETWFLIGGTTCGIITSIVATCSPGDIIIMPRNSHMSAFSGMVLSGAVPKYIVPEYVSDWDIASSVTHSQVEKAIKELDSKGQKPSAIFITSPTYQGFCANIEKISLLCKFHNIPLIVDEAHGAHLGFIKNMPPWALRQGADIVIQSTHKVLSSLTQSSMLHMSGNMVDRQKICRCLQMLQSTSPNYLLLASLDAARAQLSENPKTIFNEAVELALEAKMLIEKIPKIMLLGCSTSSDVLGIDPLRITIGVWKLGLSGFEAKEILYKDFGVLPELTGTRSLTYAVNLGSQREDILRLVAGLKYLSQMYNVNVVEVERPKPRNILPFDENSITMSLSPREAYFARKEKISFKDSIGRVCGELVCPFPPGIPVLIPGEVITKALYSYMVEVRNRGGFVIGAIDPTLSTIVVCT